VFDLSVVVVVADLDPRYLSDRGQLSKVPEFLVGGLSANDEVIASKLDYGVQYRSSSLRQDVSV
jgi:hypothetical protein